MYEVMSVLLRNIVKWQGWWVAALIKTVVFFSHTVWSFLSWLLFVNVFVV